MPTLRDLACVIHCHSTFSDGTGTVPEIAAAAARAGADAVLLTDHDSLEAKRRGHERWHGRVLMCVGEEVSPRGGNHYLAFGLDEEIRHEGLSAAQIVGAVADAGGFGFLAHPFSRGSERFRRGGIPWRDLDCGGYTGIELWSFVTDGAEAVGSVGDLVRFIASPERTIDGPPPRNLERWDALLSRRAVVAIGGVDAHQVGVRVAGRVPLRLMAYHRSFRRLRTHVLLERPPSGDAARDRGAVYAALKAGRCYLAMDSLADARGFAFWAQAGRERIEMGGEASADGTRLRIRTPAPADLTLLRDGEPVARTHGAALEHEVECPGVHRVEAALHRHGRQRRWIVSNPVYLR
ncbi:MAG: CehA/McbA family metallohydrolase [Solirubrobacteraceae bacterium]